MTRVLLLSAEYPPDPGGVGDYSCRLGQALVASGTVVDVATIQAGQFCLLDPGGQRPPRVLRTVTRRQPWGWLCWQDVIAALYNLQPQIVHIQYQTGAYAMHPAINALPWRLKALQPRPRLFVTFHDLLEPYLFPKAGPLRRYVTLRLARDCDGVVCTTNADAAALERVLPGRVWRIPIGSNIPDQPPPGYNRAGWRAQHSLAGPCFLVVFFGLISASKGLDTLLEALAQLPQQLDWRLVIVGGTASASYDRKHAARIYRQIAQLPEPERVRITGDVAAPEVSAWLRAADVVALPFHDGASYRRGSLMAALSHGCAIISTCPSDRGGDEPALEAGRHMLAIRAGDSAALAAALQQLAADPALAADLGANARCLAQQFSWEEIARRHLALYAH